MRRLLLICIPFLASLGAATAARAVVVDMNPALHGTASVTYPQDLSSGNYYGLALVPGAREGSSTTSGYLASAGIPLVTTSGACADPASSTETDILSAGSWPLSATISPICFHTGGAVMHRNETFALEWEGHAPNEYWSTTKSIVQTYLSAVAAASGSLSNPYADTTQYWDGPSAADRASNQSLFGGGCDDNGTAQCSFGSVAGSGTGNSLPSANDPSDCAASGENIFGGPATGGGFSTIANNLCVTDAQIQHEVTTLIDNDGLIAHTVQEPAYTPLVVVLTPPGVEVCLDQSNTLCSANGQLTPPPATLSTAQTGGTVAAGVYKVVVAYTNSSGQTIGIPSSSSSITASGSTSTITIGSPPAAIGATGWNAYVTQSGGTTYTLQNPTPTALGTDLTLSTPPTSSGAAPPVGTAAFCSYHGQVSDGGSMVSYVVQPWTAFTSCDEPDAPVVQADPTPTELETAAGQDLVSPLSQAEMAAIVNPYFTGWYGLDGLEINDQNGCRPLTQGLDQFTINGSSYLLQREFNNTAVVDSDPYTYSGCLPEDVLTPTFVAPSAINLGDTLDLDGSATATSLGIPNANYTWDFGDGTATGTGPSVEHTYTKGGTYTVKLTVTDRGGNTLSLSQAVQVLSATGQPVVTTSTPPTEGSGSGSGSGSTAPPPFKFSLQLLPQGFRSILRRGISVRVHSNRNADGFATISISRRLAKRAHIRTGRRPIVVIGTGTVSGVKDGVVTLRLHMSRAIAKKLRRLRHVRLNVRLVLVAHGGAHFAAVVAGRY